MLVSRCSHVWCRYCILLVFFRRWGRMINHAWPVDLIAWRRLAVCSRNVAIYITRDYILRQTKNLTFIVSHHDKYSQPILRKKKNIRENKRAKQKKNKSKTKVTARRTMKKINNNNNISKTANFLCFSFLTGYIYSNEACLNANEINTLNINVYGELIISISIVGETGVTSAFIYGNIANDMTCFVIFNRFIPYENFIMAPGYPRVRIAMHCCIYMKIHSFNDMNHWRTQWY